MSGTSHIPGREPFDALALFGGEQPVGGVRARDALIGNALHAADGAAQVRFAWMAPAAAVSSATEPWASVHPRLLTAADVWYGFFPRYQGAVSVRTDGSSYRFYVDLWGLSTNGGEVDFAVSVAAPGTSHFTYAFSSGGAADAFAQKTYSNVTSSSAVKLTPDDGLDYFEIAAEDIAAALGSDSTFTDLGGDPAPVLYPQLEFRVFGRYSGDLVSAPQLHGWTLREYIAD